MQAIILCGGKGTRLKSALPAGLPKPMVDINGKPFLEYLLSYWAPYIQTFILAVGYGHEKITRYFGNRFKDSNILYSTPCMTGTLNALEAASVLLGPGQYFVINGDTYFEVNPLNMAQDQHRLQSTITLSFSRRANVHAGVDLIKQNYTVIKPSIYFSDAYFIDIGTPENLARFRTWQRRESDMGH